MSNIATVNTLISAINHDRFAQIEACHAPGAVFASFRGPTLHDAVAITDWHRQFQRDYADCAYSELEVIEQDDVVAARATIEAKGYDWRPFSQRVLEVFEFGASGEVAARRLYGTLRDIEFDKPAATALADARAFKGGNASATGTAVAQFLAAVAASDREGMGALVHEKFALIDGVYGVAHGLEAALALSGARPKPAFGTLRPTRVIAGEHDAVVEWAIDPARPRLAEWWRLVDGKVRVVEVYWMLREIGVNPFENLAHDRHSRSPIIPG